MSGLTQDPIDAREASPEIRVMIVSPWDLAALAGTRDETSARDDPDGSRD